MRDKGRAVLEATVGFEPPYVYAWGQRLLGFSRKGELCRVLVRGGMNSCLVEFEDGYRAVISRNALRKSALGKIREG